MARVGSVAPRFRCSAVVEGRLARLGWRQLHQNRTLLLLFDALGGGDQLPEFLIALSEEVALPARPRARVAVVCRNELGELLAWAQRPRREGGPGALAFPLIADPDGRIAALYGLEDSPCPAAVRGRGGGAAGRGGARWWGHFIIDPAGVVREAAVSGFPARAGAGELLRSINACGFPADTGLRN